MSGDALFVGIGSPHGDDCVGWRVAQRISELGIKRLVVRRAQSPADVLDWLDDVEALDVCDAVFSESPPGTLHCWPWPSAAIESALFCGTHDLSLPAGLALAERLGRLPRQVRIWGVAINEANQTAPVSPDVAAATPAIVSEIATALGRQ